MKKVTNAQRAENLKKVAPLNHTKCSHTKEEGCAILGAVKEGKIAKTRHENYCMLYDVLKNKHKWDKK